ncbi:hypothetical protein EB118_22840 [bacterium]|nr:hypothetical protein [bacterium]
MTDEMKEKYIQKYKETYSVSEILRTFNDGIGRKKIINLLKEEGIYEGLNGPNYLKKKVENNEKIMMKKYGVINWGQTKDGGYKSQNKIPYKKISYLNEEYKEYKNQVEKETKLNIKNIDLPEYCFYTGIQFADVEGPVNPNDPRKRSVDHKIPVIICYLNGFSTNQASDLTNLIFVLKYVNSIKSNTDHESFLKITHKIREVFVNEGYKSK